MRQALPLACLLLAGSLASQGAVPPPMLTQFQADPIFTTPTLPASMIGQIHMIPYPGKPGLFIVAMTVTSGLPAANGAVGGYDFLTGVYDPATKTFAPDLFAAGLNGTGTEFGLMLVHDGLLAVYESNSGVAATEVRLARRNDLNSPFQPMGAVTNIVTQSYWDPALAVSGGKLYLLHELDNTAGGGDIAMSELDFPNRKIGKTTIIVNTPLSGQKANSPTPIVDSAGELIGVSHHVTASGTLNDHWVSFDLDPKTPALLFIQHPDWINNGGYIAGTFFDAHSASSGYQVSSVESAWWTGGRAARGSGMEISVYCPIQGLTAVPWVSFFMISKGFLPTGIAVPGIVGLFGLDPTFLLTVSVGPHMPQTGRASTVLNLPNDPVLRGLAVPGQSCTINPKGSGGGPDIILGNTAALTIL